MNPTAFFRPRRRLASLGLVTALAIALPLPAAAFSNVFIFGDSLSDSGNNSLALGVPGGVPQPIPNDFYIPALPYPPAGTYSNGPVWATAFAAGLGLSAAPSVAGGSNFAFGGARTAVDGSNPGGFPFSLDTQVSQFLGATGGVAPADALYVVAGGGNDARAALTALGPAPTLPEIVGVVSQVSAQFAIDVGNIVDRLQAAGAQNIVVWNAPNLGAAPAVIAQGASAVGLGTLVSQSMNNALDYRLSFETGVLTFDLFGLVGQIAANPAAFGLSNISNACVTGICMDPSSYLFWDGIHPSATGHQLIAGAMLAAIPEPSAVLLMALGVLALLGWRRAQG